MVSIPELIIGYVVYRSLSKYQLSAIVKYGVPLATGVLIIQATRPKNMAKRLISRVFS